MDAIEYFKFIRDIPFKIALSMDEPDYNCGRKHIVLKALLTSLGFKVRYVFCEWLWSSLDLPEHLKAIPHEDKVMHIFLEVYNNEQDRWMIVDATWDRKLGSRLPVSEWDGKNDTIIAVKPIKIFPGRADELTKPSEPQGKEPMKPIVQFIEGFNKWLESIRANAI